MTGTTIFLAVVAVVVIALLIDAALYGGMFKDEEEE